MNRTSGSACLVAVALLLIGPALAFAESPTPSPSSSPSPSYSPSVTVDPSSGVVGTPIAISGTGFPPAATLGLYVDQAQTYVVSPARLNGPGIQTNARGEFRYSMLMVYAGYGSHDICADSDVAKACATFHVEPYLEIEPASGPPGTPFTVTATGFPSGSYVGLYVDAPNPFFGTPGPGADFNGGFKATFRWPTTLSLPWAGQTDPTIPGPHHVCGDTGYPGSPNPIQAKACAQFVVEKMAPSIVLSDSAGAVGDQVIVTGKGFSPLTPYLLRLDATPIQCYTIATDAEGGFVAKLTVQVDVSNYPIKGRPCTEAASVSRQSASFSYGTHILCASTSPAVEACAAFTILTSPTPIAALPAASTRQPPTPPWWAILAFIAGIGLAAGVLLLVARRLRDREDRPV